VQWFDADLPEADDSWRFVSLSQLISFFSHPAKYLAEQRLGIYFENMPATLDSREPFALNGLDAWSLNQQLLDGRIQGLESSNIQPVVNAIGVLPQGQFADLLFKQKLNTADDFIEVLRPLISNPKIDENDFEFKCGKFTIFGQLDGMSVSGLLHYRLAIVKPKDILGLWISHLILSYLKPKGIQLNSRLVIQQKVTKNNKSLIENKCVTLNYVSNAEEILLDLLDIFFEGIHRPIPFFQLSSYAYAKSELNPGTRGNSDTAFKNAWSSSEKYKGDDIDPYHQQFFDAEPLTEEAKLLSLKIYEPVFNALAGDKL
jgi:exodeoxyribonuclease V gamma subunit